MRTSLAVPYALALLVAGTSALTAQCTNVWVGSTGCPGTNGGVFDAVHWDPDGPGPASSVVVLGGSFTLAGDAACSGVATWDPATGAFAALPAPSLPYAQCLAVAGNGDLLAVVAGYVGGLESWQVVVLGSAGWTPVGNAFGRFIADLHVRPNGEIVIAGALDPFGGGPSLGAAAVWSGAAWVSLGIAGWGRALGDLANGDLAVASQSTTAIAAYHVWNGTALTPFAGNGPSIAQALALAPNGVLWAMADGLWSWNGLVWTSHPLPAATGLTFGWSSRIACTAGGGVLVAGMPSSAYAPDTVVEYTPSTSSWNVFAGRFEGALQLAFLDLPAGGPLVFGWFDNVDARSATNLARWNGTVWQPLSDGPPSSVACVAPLSGYRFAIGGRFASCGTIAALHVAEWTGAAWSPMGQGLNGEVRDLQRLPNGDLLAGGDFTASGAVAASALARWDGTAWSQFGGGVAKPSGQPSVSSIAVLPNGDVVVGGVFTAAGGVPAINIARWNGTSWSALGSGVAGAVDQVAVAPNGNVVVLVRPSSGSAEVRQWDGSSWSTIASYGSAVVQALAVLADGSVALGGAVWTSFPGDWSGFFAMRDPTGMWWTATADWPVSEIVALADGDLLVFGSFTYIGPPQAPVPAAGLARWHPGSFTWTAGVAGGSVCDASFTASGELLVVGTFNAANPAPLHSVALLLTTCPATVNVLGSGCAGSGGPNVLTATSLPWLGGTFRASASGMAANGLALGVFGLGTGSVPLASILPQGVAGCSLLVAPDVLLAFVPAAGVATTQLAIPNVPALVGQSLYEQFVSLEIAGGAITALTSTNALAVTIGAF